MAEQYTRNQLKVLWHLKRHGPCVLPPSGESLLKSTASILDLRPQTLGYILRELEAKCLVLRSYSKGKPTFAGRGSGEQATRLIRIELVDPSIWLPELPPPLPLGTVMRNENNDLYDRTAHLPSEERVIQALLNRIDELQTVIDKLHHVVNDQAQENETLKEQVGRLTQPARRRVREHLYDQVRNRLPPEQAEALEHLHDDD